MMNDNNEVNYEPSIKQKEKKYSLSTVLAWLYLKTIGRILPERWNKWSENILHHNKVIVDSGFQTEIMSKNKTTKTQYDKIEGKNFQASSEFKGKKELEDKNKELKEQLEGVSQALEAFIGLCNNQAQQIKDLELESNVLKEEKEQLNSIIKGLEKNYRELEEIAQKRGEEFLAQLKKKSEEILHLQKELIECSKEFANKTEMLSVRLEEKDLKIGSLTQLNKSLEQEKKEMETKNNEQKQTIFAKEKEIEEKNTLITSLIDKNKDMDETVKRENTILLEQNTELKSKVSELKNESDTQIKQLENQLEEKQAELEQAEKKNAEFRKELESAQQQLVQKNTDLTNQLQDLSSKLHAAEIKKKELEDEVNELKEKAKKKDAELEVLKQQLEKDKSDSISKINATKKEKKELEGEVNELKDKVQTLEKNRAEIEKQKADLEKKLESSQGENKKLQKQVEHPSAKKTENVTTVSIRNSKEIPNQSVTSKPEGRQQKLQNKQKDASKKPEDINKKTKADTKSIFSTSGSVKSKFSNNLSKLRGNDSLDKFLSDQNTKLKKSFPESKEKHFCHNVLKETIKSLSNQGDGKFESDKLLELLKSNLMKYGRAIIEIKVNTVVEKVGKKHSIEQVFFVKECAKGLYLNEEDSKAVIHSFTDFLAHKNNSNNDSVKKFVVQKLTEAEMKCFSDKIQGLQLASSIRDKFLSPDQGMCVQTSKENNEYELTDKAKKEYTPNSSMSHTNSTPVSVKQEARSR
ncbi:hypothetical protein [Wolbachia endosymbiont of Encarsia formosa]|uniref:hypothetical protein n=1 Tax=Wolbachia endosymbiont of Encarsia formosa TaxID=77125 RepID=UPI0031BB50F5